MIKRLGVNVSFYYQMLFNFSVFVNTFCILFRHIVLFLVSFVKWTGVSWYSLR